MKNIHILPTDKPRFDKYLVVNKESKFCIWNTETMGSQKTLVAQNIYFTNDEEIKEGGYVFWEGKIYTYREFMKMRTPVYTDYFSIILTTDQDLIKDGIQAIPDEFLEWFVKNPSCEEVDIDKINLCTQTGLPCGMQCLSEETCNENISYKIIIPKEEILPEQIWNEEKIEGIKKLIHRKQKLIDIIKSDEQLGLYEQPKQQYKYIGECKGNNDNGCFMNSSGHNCGCFIRVPKEEPKFEDSIENSVNIMSIANSMFGKKEHKRETLEEAYHVFLQKKYSNPYLTNNELHTPSFEFGIKWQQEQDKNKYSEEEVKAIINDIVEKHCTYFEQKLKDDIKIEWFEKLVQMKNRFTIKL